jgi:predicted nucleotide-binding protein (sugar kinase/HSP70/actin superfamily)
MQGNVLERPSWQVKRILMVQFKFSLWGCMPEIVSKSILPTVSKNENIPILSLVVDELTGEDGYITRIEAFLDLLERRKNNVLYGN